MLIGREPENGADRPDSADQDSADDQDSAQHAEQAGGPGRVGRRGEVGLLMLAVGAGPVIGRSRGVVVAMGQAPTICLRTVTTSGANAASA